MPNARDGDDLALRLAVHLDSAFEALVLAYQDRIYRFALRLCGHPSDAEEIAQDTFIRAYRALAHYPADRIQELHLRPWLYTICLNVVRNRMRRHTLPSAPFPLDMAASVPGPEDVAEGGERVRDLERMLLALPEKYRAAVVLRHIEELGIAEIAAVVGQPEGTVKSNIFRGMQMLRAMAHGGVREVAR